MLRQRLCGWWKRGSADDFRDTLERYEEQAEAHRQAAEMARSVGSDAGYAHQMQLKDWYEQEAERLRKKLAKRQQH